MSRGVFLYVAAGIMLVLLIAAVALLSKPGGGGGLFHPLASGTNPGLDVRYKYDPAELKPADYDPGAEFALRLNGPGWSFYGKRIAGMGTMLTKQPAALLYDFVGSQANDVFESWYKLQPAVKPHYEDARIQGKLGVHVTMEYQLAPDSRGWPPYFPAQFQAHGQSSSGGAAASPTAYIENWDFYTPQDLFFFYAVSDKPLTSRRRGAALTVMNTLKFGAVLGNSAAPPSPTGGTSGTSPGTASP